MKKHGLYWHVHHDRLYEWCWDEEERRDAINEKIQEEIEVRQQRLQPVRGTLGNPDLLAASEQARVAMDQARAASEQAFAASERARDAYMQAWAAYKHSVSPASAELLHAQECLNCPWDGVTLFPERAESDA